MKKNKIYFASDFHLGSPNLKESHTREKLIVKWLDDIKNETKSIYLLGDIFDFWFEYKKVVPKGFIRLLAKLSELVDSGTDIYLFCGNHDLWMKEYLEEEIGVKIYKNSRIINEQNKKLFIGHGDSHGNGDYFYKFLRRIFTSKLCCWAFSRLHPNLAFSIAHRWSKFSRKTTQDSNFNKNKELLLDYCKEQQKTNPVDYYIFGHRHIPMELSVDTNTIYINTGDWVSHNSYAVLSNGELFLKKYKN